MADNNQSAALPLRRFVALTSVSISDVKSKFAKKEIIHASEFVSARDPQLPSFGVTVEFGSRKAQHLSVFVYPVSRVVSFTKMKCDVFDDAGKRLRGSEGFEDGVEQHTRPVGELLGWTNLLKSRKLGDEIAIKIEFEYEVTLTPALDVPGHHSLLRKDYAELLASGQLADVTFLVQDQKIPAHKAVLAARCSSFRRMFATHMIEQEDSGVVNVGDVRPEIIQAMLKYVYAGQMPGYSGQDAMDLVAVADKFGVDELRKQGEADLCRQLTKENVIEALVFADRLNCPELMLQATNVFKKHMGELKKGEKWDDLMSNPELPLKMLGLFCDE